MTEKPKKYIPPTGRRFDRLTPEQLDELVVHLIAHKPLSLQALGRLSVDDFCTATEPVHKLLWGITCDIYEQSGVLPTRTILELESAARAEPFDFLNSPERTQLRSQLIERAFGGQQLNPAYAQQLLGDLIWHRQVALPLVDAATQQFLGTKAWESIQLGHKNAELGGAVVDLAQHSVSALLKCPDIFKPATFVSSGYKRLDEVLGGGLALGEMTTLVGPVSLGKTSFMANLAVNAAGAGTPTLVVSLEMARVGIVQLVLCIVGKIRRTHLRKGALASSEQHALSATVSRLSVGYPLHVVDRSVFTENPNQSASTDMASVEALIRQAVEHFGVRLVMIDYLAKIGPFDAEETKRMAQLNAWAFNLAQSGIHLIALAQQNKASYGNIDKKSKNRFVGLQDVRGVIESVADADNVLALVRDDWNTGTPSDPSEMKAVVLKCRQGPGGEAPLLFFRSTGLIVEPTTYTSGGAQPNGANAKPAPPGNQNPYAVDETGAGRVTGI